MPLILNKQIDKETTLGLWRIDETKEILKGQVDLTPTEEAQYASFGSEVRKKQWLSYRILLKKILFPKLVLLEYDIYGKPRLRDHELQLSISHSGPYSAVIVSQRVPVGIDIECLKERIFRIKDRFLTTEEDQNIGETNRLEKLYIAWGAKEALYKIYGRPEVDFLRDIFIDSFPYLCSGKGQCTARMKTPEGSERYDVFYERISGYMLVYALKSDTQR